ncbi:unnamed protein product [Diamesa serratosioi]
MRTNKKLVITIFIIGFWTFLTYFILIRNTESKLEKKSELLKSVQLLENEIKEEHSVRHELGIKYRNLIDILKDKQVLSLSTTSDIANQNSKTLTEEDVDNNLYNKIDFVEKYVDGDINRPVIPVLVFACNRVSVAKSLETLISFRPSREQFPIIVSQDCADEATRNVILSFKDEVQLILQPDQSEMQVPPKEKKFKGYYKISRHYNWALNTTFKYGYDFVIIVEDDLSVAPDFYEYFLGTFQLLRNDKTLWCVSAWNDNGKVGLIDESKPETLYRSDFFPGLGWMLSKELWDELSVKWPKAFWDDWIRQPEQRKDRACIRPELPRTRTFGKIGVSNGLFFEKHLKYIKLSEDFVPFSKKDLTYLLQSNYDEAFKTKVYQTPIVTYEELRRGLVKTKDAVRIQYNNRNQYKSTAKMLGLMDDFKSGVPRTAYLGVISFFFNNQRVYLAPSANWIQYDPSWS